ncbi:MAG: amidohydrolase family protein [Planctomycetes bacterium]|nr:amidohydrolase family protein [Planctomycetota bacterium]
MLILHAQCVLSPGSPDLPDGAVVLQDHKILECLPFSQARNLYPDAQIIDLTHCALLPGLINAHTHLELTPLCGQIPYHGNFFSWVSSLTDARRNYETSLDEVIADACQQFLKAGVTTVGDICFGHRAWPHLASQPVRKVCFAEVFGITADSDSPRQYLRKCLKQTQTNDLLTLGLSPHAPYSAAPHVYQTAAQIAAANHLPITTHLAETTDEIEFLTSGTGPCYDYLKRIDRWDGSFVCPHRSPVDYFLSLDLPPHPFLLAHVNYLTEDELLTLSQTSHSVVYCPRSHRFFQHPPHPFQKMLAAGINLCLGTDSLASNQTLSILDEIRFLHREYPNLKPSTLLKMATINGAAALHLQDKIGIIAPDYQADLIAIPLTKSHPNPLTDILTSSHQPALTMITGRILHHL